MKRLLVISDDHGSFDETIKILQKEDYDISIHLGDSEVNEKMVKSNFTYYVGGNHANFSTLEDVVVVDGLRIAIAHGHTIGVSMFSHTKGAVAFAKRVKATVALHGHTHIAKDETLSGIRVINPGSTILPRNFTKPSYAIITIDKGSIKDVKFVLVK